MKNYTFTVIPQNMVEYQMSVREADAENDVFRMAFDEAKKDDKPQDIKEELFALDFFKYGWEAAVRCLNDDNYALIENPNELLVNREYWIRDKLGGESVVIGKCSMRDGKLFFFNHIWGHEGNNQAMQKWDIFGPLPMRMPDHAVMNAAVAASKLQTVPPPIECVYEGNENNSPCDECVKQGHCDGVPPL